MVKKKYGRTCHMTFWAEIKFERCQELSRKGKKHCTVIFDLIKDAHVAISLRRKHETFLPVRMNFENVGNSQQTNAWKQGTRYVNLYEKNIKTNIVIIDHKLKNCYLVKTLFIWTHSMRILLSYVSPSPLYVSPFPVYVLNG